MLRYAHSANTVSHCDSARHDTAGFQVLPGFEQTNELHLAEMGRTLEPLWECRCQDAR